MPAYYFPIFSKENLIEKMAEIIRINQKYIDIPKEIENLKKQLPKLKYPISSGEELVEILGEKVAYKFEKKSFNLERVVEQIPSDYFPIKSENEFYEKTARLMAIWPFVSP